MIRLPLEVLLEIGFEALGAEFKPRSYAEELLAGASVDDVLTGYSIREHEAQVRHLTESEYFASLVSLTDFQRQVLGFDEAPIFFLRSSGDCNGWSVEYVVSSTEKRYCYGSEADRIVREDLIDNEVVNIQYEGLDVVNIVRSVQPDGSDDVFVYGVERHKLEAEGWESELKSALDGKLAVLAEFDKLHERPFDPILVYRAIFNFLKA